MTFLAFQPADILNGNFITLTGSQFFVVSCIGLVVFVVLKLDFGLTYESNQSASNQAGNLILGIKLGAYF